MTPTGSQRNRRLRGFDPIFSPDGRRLAAAHPTRRGERVYGVSVYGPRRPRRLTAEDATRAYDESEPTWSPSGGRLAFTRRYRGRDANGQVTYDLPAIYLARAGATGATRLEDGMQAAWSTRDRIAYVGFSADSEEPDGIYAMRADGTHVRQLTYGEETSPQWSPDGRHIAFVRNGHVFVMRGDGSYLRRVTNSGNSDSGPAWSPDGANIVFDRTDSWLATEEIDSVSVRTGRVHCVRKTHDDALFYLAPDWQPLPR